LSFSFTTATEEYDAIIIGAGHNGLTCACYLATAGLKVLVLEQYHSIGGMTITEEITLPGFKSDVHAFGYQLANLSPVPKELSLDKYGFELKSYDISYSHIFPEGRGHLSLYKDIQRTMKSIERYSRKDALTWEKMFYKYMSEKESVVSSINSPPVPLPSAVEHMDNDLEAFDRYKSNIQSMRSWSNEWFESEEAKVLFGSFAAFVGLSPDDAGGGQVSYLFSTVIQDTGNAIVKGGFSNLPLALARYLESRGGKILTNANVQQIIIDKEKQRAIGIRLDNGKEIGVRKVIASSTDPSTLLLKMIGEEYLEARTVGRLKKLEWGDAVMAIYLALDKAPEYYADEKEEVSSSPQVHLSPPSIDSIAKTYYECRAGMLPSEPLLIMSNDSIDPSRVPLGKHLIKFLILNVPYKIKHDLAMRTDIRKDVTTNKDNANIDKSIEWDNVKEEYGDWIIDLIMDKYMPNLKEISLKKVVLSPVDFETRPSTSVYGTLTCGSLVPYQTSSMRPVPELAGYKVPSLSNVYLCGSANHPGPGVSMAPGRNASQVILYDLNLDFTGISSGNINDANK
jgi:beta-carotene ketolase (CrtO type)